MLPVFSRLFCLWSVLTGTRVTHTLLLAADAFENWFDGLSGWRPDTMS